MKRGIAYFGVRNPEWVRIDMQRIRSEGYTHVLHTWSEEDLHYYSDTMAEIIRISNECGLQVYTNPWGVGRVFGGEAYSELSARNPEQAQVGSDGKPRAASCPNHPMFREYLHRWIDTVCATSVETIFWDEPHFDFVKGVDHVWCCRCSACQTLFQARFGIPMPPELTEEVRQFREDSLIEFLEEMTLRVASHGKRNSVCMLPPWFSAGLDDWSRVARIASVHEIGSDPYWEKTTDPSTVRATYSEVSAKTLAIAHAYAKEAQMWVKNYHIVAGTEHCVVDATEAAFEAGIRNIFAWSYLGSSYLSWLRSDNPELVWKQQSDALRRLDESQ